MIVGRRFDAAALTIAFVAALADVPINLIAVEVSARARLPVWKDDGEVPYRGGSYI
jgi:hypothetical protein